MFTQYLLISNLFANSLWPLVLLCLRMKFKGTIRIVYDLWLYHRKLNRQVTTSGIVFVVCQNYYVQGSYNRNVCDSWMWIEYCYSRFFFNEPAINGWHVTRDSIQPFLFCFANSEFVQGIRLLYSVCSLVINLGP